MMKNVTTLIATHRKTVVRKATVIGGVILGIGIGLLLNKVDDDDMVIVNGEYTEEEVEQFFEDDEPKAVEGNVIE